MSDFRKIVWLASYPKSGNTWARMFLANYLVNGDQPFPINQAHRFAMSDSALQTYKMVAGRPVDPRNADDVLRLRDRVLQGVVANGADVNFVKTHNMPGRIKGHFMIPNKFTRSAIYVVRNPLDVVLSYARHFGRNKERAVQSLARADNWIAPTEHLVPQYLGRWDAHVKGWTKPADYPQLVLRYEDLLTDPAAEFTKLLEHVGIPVEPARLQKAVEFSSFKVLAGQERSGGFDEKSTQATAFFSKGQSGQWKDDLAPELVEKIKAEHGKTMKKYGYLDE
ncbi:MAG: sulfotransferase domain-containing protein [Pseudomonadota bacterium]